MARGSLATPGQRGGGQRTPGHRNPLSHIHCKTMLIKIARQCLTYYFVICKGGHRNPLIINEIDEGLTYYLVICKGGHRNPEPKKFTIYNRLAKKGNLPYRAKDLPPDFIETSFSVRHDPSRG